MRRLNKFWQLSNSARCRNDVRRTLGSMQLHLFRDIINLVVNVGRYVRSVSPACVAPHHNQPVNSWSLTARVNLPIRPREPTDFVLIYSPLYQINLQNEANDATPTYSSYLSRVRYIYLMKSRICGLCTNINYDLDNQSFNVQCGKTLLRVFDWDGVQM